MKFPTTLLFLTILFFASPVFAKDKLDKELKKERKRFSKEIQEMKKASSERSFVVRKSKFQS